ncbi:hypothetical protein B5P41_31665, partial [Bacillus sp. SRB_28]
LGEASGASVSDIDLMTTVCFSIMHVEKYRTTVEVIMQGLVLTKAEMMNRLLTAEQRLSLCSIPEPQTAFGAEEKKREKPKRRGKCYNCGKAGHWGRDCGLPKKNQRASVASEVMFMASHKEDDQDKS